MNIVETTAENVEEGDFLPELDNGYVFEVNDRASDVLMWSGYYSSAMDNQLVFIGYHDANGEENYLVLRPSHPLNVGKE